jgi:nucleotide-binding universal stress UspA family protein
MEKLTSILVVARDVASNEVVLGKAVALARRCGARIEVLLTEATAACALATWFSSVGFGNDRVSYVLQDHGAPLDDVIVRHLENHPADLVMKGADAALARRRVLRAADDLELAARLPVPLLRVSAKPWKKDMRIAAAVDVSAREGDALARSIVQAAGLIAMECEATLEVLYSERESGDDRLRMERAVRVARLVREFHVGGERLRVLNGPPDKTLPKAVSAGEYDLVVVGATSHRPAPLPWTPLLTCLLANASSGDVMFVKETQRVSREVLLQPELDLASLRPHP